MNYRVTEIINAILYELEEELEPKFFRWVEAETSRNLRWVNTTDRFENAMVKAMHTHDYTTGKKEGEIYKSDMLSLIREFHAANGTNETESFLKALEADNGSFYY